MSTSCCALCCRAIDFGVHDYCVPCKTNPVCPTSYPREEMEGGQRMDGANDGVSKEKTGEKADEKMVGEKGEKGTTK